MRVLGINGSPRRDGNTGVMVGWVLDELTKLGVETEMFHLAGKPLRGCIDCRRCFVNKDQRCNMRGDALNSIIERMMGADAMVIGAPTYFANVNAEVKALIERVGMVAAANDHMFKRKVGAAVVSARRGGAIDTFNAINHLYLHAEMIVPGSSYWNMGFAPKGRDIEDDAEAERTMRTLGQNMFWVLEKIVPAATE